MKKRVLTGLLVASMVCSMTACNVNGNKSTGADATETADTADTGNSKNTAEFNPDTEEDSMSIEEVREKFGDVTVASDIQLGAVEKSLSNEYWRTLQQGYEEAVDYINEQTGVNVKVEVDATTDESDETGQQTMVENMTNQGVDVLLLSPISDSNLTAAVENAQEAKIPVYNVNDGVIATSDYYAGPNAYQNGQLAAEWISEKLGDEGQVAIVIGMAKAFAARERTSGFKDWIEDNNSGLEIVAEQNADWDRQKAKDLATTWIQQNPELKAIFCNNDDMALGVVEAVKEAEAEILVVGVDGIGEAYDSIRAGELSATVDSFPYYTARVATECALRVLAGQEMPRVVATPQALIDSENVDKDAAEIIGWQDADYVAK